MPVFFFSLFLLELEQFVIFLRSLVPQKDISVIIVGSKIIFQRVRFSSFDLRFFWIWIARFWTCALWDWWLTESERLNLTWCLFCGGKLGLCASVYSVQVFMYVRCENSWCECFSWAWPILSGNTILSPFPVVASRFTFILFVAFICTGIIQVFSTWCLMYLERNLVLFARTLVL